MLSLAMECGFQAIPCIYIYIYIERPNESCQQTWSKLPRTHTSLIRTTNQPKYGPMCHCMPLQHWYHVILKPIIVHIASQNSTKQTICQAMDMSMHAAFDDPTDGVCVLGCWTCKLHFPHGGFGSLVLSVVLLLPVVSVPWFRSHPRSKLGNSSFCLATTSCCSKQVDERSVDHADTRGHHAATAFGPWHATSSAWRQDGSGSGEAGDLRLPVIQES